MNLTYFYPKMRRNVANKNSSPVNIRFVAKTSDIRNLSENIRSDVKTSEVATLVVAIGRKVRFHHTLHFMTKRRSQFGCGYLQTAQEVTKSLIPNNSGATPSVFTLDLMFFHFIQCSGVFPQLSYFSGVFVCNLWFLLMVRVNVVSCRVTLQPVEIFFLSKNKLQCLYHKLSSRT